MKLITDVKELAGKVIEEALTDGMDILLILNEDCYAYCYSNSDISLVSDIDAMSKELVLASGIRPKAYYEKKDEATAARFKARELAILNQLRERYPDD